MQKILITLVVQNSNTGDETETVKQELVNKLPTNNRFIAKNTYEKFPNCFMLDFEITYSKKFSNENLLFEMLKISSVIAAPWLIYFDEENSELILNKSNSTQFANQNFGSIFWAHIQKA